MIHVLEVVTVGFLVSIASYAFSAERISAVEAVAQSAFGSTTSAHVAPDVATATTLNSVTTAGKYFAIRSGVETLLIAVSVARSPASIVRPFQPVKHAMTWYATIANMFQAAVRPILSCA
jgi:hypothetical protein